MLFASLALLLAGCGTPSSESDGACDLATFYADLDYDGYGDAASPVEACREAAGVVPDAGDCDDTRVGVNPGRVEVCNGVDDDCDGVIDPAGLATASVFYVDADADGYGDHAQPVWSCEAPAGTVAGRLDCDDADASVQGPSTWFRDADGDGYGDPADATPRCEQPDGYVASADDCDDTDATLSPETPWYADADGDGLGDPGAVILSCVAPAGHVPDGADCDDTDAATLGPLPWWEDADGDGYGGDIPVAACAQPEGAVAGTGDCADTDAAYHPGAGEPDCADLSDHDCDGYTAADDVDADGFAACEDCDDRDAGVRPDVAWYADADGDTHGDAAVATTACRAPAGYVAVADDCDDTDASVAIPTDWYADADLDGHGDPATASTACHRPGGYVASGADCDDADPDAHPAGTEICSNGVDEDCDGEAIGCGYSGSASLDDADARLLGESAADHACYVSSIGDQNGDGLDDVMVGAPNAALVTGGAGVVYIVHGGVTGDRDLGDYDASLEGRSWDGVGDVLANAGDVDGDGTPDMLLGKYTDSTAGTNAGAAFLVLGPFTGDRTLDEAASMLTGVADEAAGYAVAGAGDMDGDGLDDLLVAAPRADVAVYHEGWIYLVSGPPSGDMPLSAADAVFEGTISSEYAGDALTSAGDVNGDGSDDLALASPGGDVDGDGNRDGFVGVWYGPVSGSYVTNDADALLTDYEAVSSVAAAGDTDGDGYDDLLVGDEEEDSSGSFSGAAYLALGPHAGTIDLSGAAAQIYAGAGGDYLGGSVTGPGDVDGDGLPDLFVGAPQEDSAGFWAGAAYLLLSPVRGTVDVTAADASFYGSATRDDAGRSVAGAGDTNGDGYADLLVGSCGNSDGGGTDAGAAYLLLGWGI